MLVYNVRMPVAPLKLKQTSVEGLYRLTSKSGLGTPSTPTCARRLIRLEIAAVWIYTAASVKPVQVDNVRHVKGVCNVSVGTGRVNGANVAVASFISSFSRLLSLHLFSVFSVVFLCWPSKQTVLGFKESFGFELQ